MAADKKFFTMHDSSIDVDNRGASGIDTVSFNCTGCGKCCNSAPLMSLPELFYHENLFVGCRSLRRIKRYKAGEILIAANTRYPVSPADDQMLAEMAETQLFNPGPVNSQGDYDVVIMTQAIDYESINKCPALDEDNHCSIYDDRKPVVCSMVPFDSLYPDSLQNIVLMSRDFGENCIVSGHHDNYQVVVKDRQVVSFQYQNELKQRRNDLYLEKQWWGNAVLALLQNEVFCNPAEMAKIPIENGLLTLSIIPALMVLAGYSEKTNARCLQYVDSQITLVDNKIKQAILRKSAADKQMTKQFRLFKEAYLKFRHQLVASQQNPKLYSRDARNEDWINSVENYLGVAV